MTGEGGVAAGAGFYTGYKSLEGLGKRNTGRVKHLQVSRSRKEGRRIRADELVPKSFTYNRRTGKNGKLERCVRSQGLLVGSDSEKEKKIRLKVFCLRVLGKKKCIPFNLAWEGDTEYRLLGFLFQ